MSIFLFTKVSSLEYMIYCWYYFKIRSNVVFLFNNVFNKVPNIWFRKLSYLLKNQIYDYKNLFTKKNTYNKVTFVKNMFIEFLFICGIKPFFQRFYKLELKGFLKDYIDFNLKHYFKFNL